MKYIRKSILMILLLSFLLPVSGVLAEENADERIYYILVDRFVNGTSDNDQEINIDDPQSYHGGDFEGITSRITDLKELGITTINLSPIMTSSNYHGFHTKDYQNIDPQFGDISDLQNLVAEAHENDMKVVLDMSLTHVSPEHVWVTENTNWIDGVTTNEWGEELPALDLTDVELQEYFYETAVHWLSSTDIDGFHLYVNENTPIDFIETLRERVLSEKDTAMVMVDGMQEAYQVNHAFREQAVDSLKQAGESIEPLFELTDSQHTYYMESVMTPRFAHEAVKEGYHPVSRWKLASTLLYTWPGSSMLYQGIEVPMDNGKEEPDHRMAELSKEDEEITQHLEKLATIYDDSIALQSGELEFVQQEGAMTVYKRSKDEQTMYIAINNDTETKMASLEGINEDYQLRGLLQDNIVRSQDDGSFKMILERETSNIFIMEENTGFNWLFITAVVLVLGGFVSFVVAVNMRVRRAKKKQGNSI